MSGVIAGISSGSSGLPAQASLMGAWFADQAKVINSVPYVPNFRYATSPFSNSVVEPRDKAFIPTTVSGGTLTIGGQSDPYGGTTANRWLTAGTTSPYILFASSLTAGTYTIQFKYKSNTVSPPTLSVAAVAAFGPYSITPTTSYQTFTQTFTLGASTAFNVQLFLGSGATTCDLSFTELDIFAGSSAGTHVDADLYGHMSTGRGIYDANQYGQMTAGSDYLDGTSQASGIISFPPAGSAPTAGTIMAVAKLKVTAGMYYNCAVSSYENGSIWLGERLNGSLQPQGLTGFVGLGATGAGLVNVIGSPPSQDWYILGTSFGAAGAANFAGPAQTGYAASFTAGTHDFDSFFINNNVAALDLSAYYIHAIAVWNGQLSPSEYNAAYTYLSAHAAAHGITVHSPCTLSLCLEGDSITAGYGTYNEYHTQAVTSGAITTPTVGMVQAIGGSTMANVASRLAADSQWLPVLNMNSRSVYSLLVGANDLDSLGATTYLTNLRAHLTNVYAAGWKKILLCTLTGKSTSYDPPFNGLATTVNAAINSSFLGVYCDAIADFGSITGMGPDGSWNASYFEDGVEHPGDSGFALMAPVWSAALNSL